MLELRKTADFLSCKSSNFRNLNTEKNDFKLYIK